MRLFAALLLLLVAPVCRAQSPDDLSALVDRAFERAVVQYTRMDETLPDTLFPRSTNPDGSLRTNPSGWWTSGFFPGSLWYLYEHTGDLGLKERAVRRTHAVEREATNAYDHDIGFKLYNSFGNGLRLTDDRTYVPVLVTAARTLLTRYDPRVGLIRSWGTHPDDERPYLVIIDNMMNLELLFWATKQTGDSTFHRVALAHADSTLKHHFRPDGSSYHVVEYDPTTGRVLRKRTAQGYADASAWARGQAWGLYGYTMAYRETGLERYLDQARRIADFMLNHPNLPDDKVPYWDFNAPDIPNALRDASAGAITASALLELSRYVDEETSRFYRSNAETMIRTLASDRFLAPAGGNNHFILKHGVGHLPDHSEVDAPLSYADYYFLEAMLRWQAMNRKP